MPGRVPKTLKADNSTTGLATGRLAVPAGPNATSRVYLALDGCIVLESWDGGRGHTGENMFGYSADDKSWHGMFADNQGRVHVFVHGQVASGSAEFSGPVGERTERRFSIESECVRFRQGGGGLGEVV